MDVSRLSQGQLIAGVSAIALFIVMFLPWFGIPGVEAQVPEGIALPEGTEVPGTESENLNAWKAENPLDIYLLIVVLVALAGVLMAGEGALPISASAATTVLGAIGTLLVLYQVFDVPGDLDRKIGLFLGLIAVAGVTVGGWLSMQDEVAPGRVDTDRF